MGFVDAGAASDGLAGSQGELMIRRALLLLALAGIYVLVKRNAKGAASPASDHDADARWATEGGANAPASV